MVFLALPLILLLTYLVLALFGVADFVAVILLLVALFVAVPCLLLGLRRPFRLWRIFAAAAGYGVFWWLIAGGSILADQSDRYGPLFLGHQPKENHAITIEGGLWLAGFALPFAGAMLAVLVATALLSRLQRAHNLARQEGPRRSV